jgi:hypothetical protein
MTTCRTPRSCRRPSLFSLLVVLCAISLSCNTLSGLVPTPGEEATEPGAEQGEAPPEALEAQELPAVLGFVLDPDGVPVAYASVEGEITDSNGGVSGDLKGSASGWLDVQSLGYADGFAKPGAFIGETVFFEARLTPMGAFQRLESGQEAVLALGDASQPVAQVRVSADAMSELPAYVEATVYDLVDVGPRYAGLSSGEELDLKLALAVQASSAGLEPVELAIGGEVSLSVFPNLSLPADPVLAIFDPETGLWETQPGACTQGEEGVLNCAIPRFAPLVGLFGPGEASSAGGSIGLSRALWGVAARGGEVLQDPTGDDQAYQNAKDDVEEWARLGEEMIDRTGSVSAEWEAEMSNRLGRLADAADLYATQHPGDPSGITHLMGAAQAAMKAGEQGLADKLIEEAKAAAEAMADELLSEADCGRIHEMLLLAQQLMLLGSQAKAEALVQKLQTSVADCDVWIGTIDVSFSVAATPPKLGEWALESGGGKWTEAHTVRMWTNVSTYILKGEDSVKLNFGQVMHGKRDDHGCHTYMTHSGEGGYAVLKFDGRFDGHTISVGDLQPEGPSASIVYGAHGERWDDEEEKCEVIDDQAAPAPNYTTVLRHGFPPGGAPSITIQRIVDQADDNFSFSGSEQISNNAFQLFIFPAEQGTVRWHFTHVQRYLPVKK